MTKLTKQEQLRNRKIMLLVRMEQQRLDMFHSAQSWLDYTAPIDHYYLVFNKVRKPLFIGIGLAILLTLRHPAKAAKVSRTAIKAWSATRLVQKLINYSNRV